MNLPIVVLGRFATQDSARYIHSKFLPYSRSTAIQRTYFHKRINTKRSHNH